MLQSAALATERSAAPVRAAPHQNALVPPAHVRSRPKTQKDEVMMGLLSRVMLILMLFTGVGLTVAARANAAKCCDSYNDCCTGACCYATVTDCDAFPCPV
jgi:hypothetical protein